MRLAHVIYHLEIGGGEVFLAHLVTALASLGFEQQVYCVGPAGPLAARVRAAGVAVHALNKFTRLGLGAVAGLTAALRAAPVDVVQLHGEAGVLWGLPAARLAQARRISVLLYQNYRESTPKMLASRALLPRAHTVIAGSESVRRFATEYLGAPRARTRVIPCGIDVSAFAAAGSARIAGATEARVVTTIGRLVPRKGQDVAIRAVAMAARNWPDIELRIVGDGPERVQLERVAAQCGISSRVRFLGTVWPTADVLRQTDLFVFPSMEEPQGLALLEACAAGVPIVASRTGGIPEMVADGQSAVLVRPGDPQALATAIVGLFGDPAKRMALVQSARERVEAFDIARIASQYCSLYDEMLSTPPVGSAVLGAS